MTPAMLKEGAAQYRDDINLRKGKRDGLIAQKEQKDLRVLELNAEAEKLRQVARLFALVGDYARRESKETMERLVTSALATVFQNDLVFQIEMEEHGERAEADFYVSSSYGGQDVVKNDPREARGGGIVDVIALALRVALLETARPKLNGPLILDEPGKHVSEEYSRQVAEFLNAISQSFDRQVILVTHNQHLMDAGAVSYHVEIKNGASVVTRRFSGHQT
jgi:DNA repair exonuclease SbcCD ATPase subunit